jgi:hypothetical protein
MGITRWLADFAITFAVTLVVSVCVTFVWSLVVQGRGAVEWETSLRFALIFGLTFGVLLPWTRARERRMNGK